MRPLTLQVPTSCPHPTLHFFTELRSAGMPPSRTPRLSLRSECPDQRSQPSRVLAASRRPQDVTMTIAPVPLPVVDDSPENPFHQGFPASSSAGEFRLRTPASIASASGSPTRLHLVRYRMMRTQAAMEGPRDPRAQAASHHDGTFPIVLLKPQGQFNCHFAWGSQLTPSTVFLKPEPVTPTCCACKC